MESESSCRASCVQEEEDIRAGVRGEEWRQLGREAKEDAGCDR